MSLQFHEHLSFESIRRRFFWYDHFEGQQIKDEWRSTGDAGGSAVVVDSQAGAVVRLTTDGDISDQWALDWGSIRSLHVDQKVTFEARVLIANITAINAQIGIRLDANNSILFIESGVNWLIRCRNNGIITQPASGIVLDTDYHIFRIECHTHGGNHVHFYIDTVQTNNSPVTTNIPDDIGDFLQPYLLIDTSENVSKTMDIDYTGVRQER